MITVSQLRQPVSLRALTARRRCGAMVLTISSLRIDSCIPMVVLQRAYFPSMHSSFCTLSSTLPAAGARLA